MCACLSHVPYWACNSGMCPDRELNQQPFGLQAGDGSTEPHQPGHLKILLLTNIETTCSFTHFLFFLTPLPPTPGDYASTLCLYVCACSG